MNPSFYRRDGTTQEMDSSPLTLLLLSLVFMRFVSAADPNNATIKVEPGNDVILPCKLPDQGDIRIAEWKRNDLGDENVLLYRDGKINQHPSYTDRVDLLVGQLKKGDASLILQNTVIDDSGTYLCRVTKGLVEKLISTVSLVVAPRPPEQFPVWVKVLLVLLVLALVAAAGVSFYFWLRWKPGPEQVEVESGEKFVHLPLKVQRYRWFCKYRLSVAKVEWKDRDNRTVHLYQDGSDQPEEQHQFYKDRTNMDENLLETGDLSLTLSWPTDGDGDSYTCRVYSRKGNVLMKKQVQLQVKAQQVEVEPGVEFVLLPCRTTEDLDGDVRVEWRDGYNRTVHVYQNGSDQPVEQDQDYRTRTKMNENLLRNKNLSLTLRRPTEGDSNIYTCRVYRGGKVLMKKEVVLKVKVPEQVEVESGVESVLLPSITTDDLDGDIRVEWRDGYNRTVHVYPNGSDQPIEQDQDYRTRTKMDENLLRNKNLSLTLRRPTEGDSNTYTCRVYRGGNVLMKKEVVLKVKGTVQVQPDDNRKPLMADQSEMVSLIISDH